MGVGGGVLLGRRESKMGGRREGTSVGLQLTDTITDISIALQWILIPRT